ncbi:odorant receptor 13a-like [Prorops nasuta]|uniref:odorant receptor 13a-like n=1 Tax=Prorops nasuta TaxID=863751 RepID=UPI0034CD63D2
MISREEVFKMVISPPLELGLRSFGVWPGSTFPRLYQFIWAISMILALVLQFWYVIIRIGVASLPELLECICTIFTYIVAFSKLIFFWANRRIFYWILEGIHEDWKENIDADWSRRIIYRKAKLAMVYCNWIMGIDMSTGFFYGMTIITTDSINYWTAADKANVTRNFVIRMELPFDSQATPIYEFVLITQFMNELAMVVVGATVNCVVISLIFHISGQIDIIRERFISLDRNSDSTFSILRSLVSKHQKLIIFSENIEHLFSYIALVQFLFLTLLICCLGLQFVITLDAKPDYLAMILIQLLGYYLTMNLEAFIICYAGEYLSEQSKSIGEAAYNIPWYNMTKRECSILLPVILRSQKQLKITIGKFMDLTLERFASIVKASLSYMSVLYALY